MKAKMLYVTPEMILNCFDIITDLLGNGINDNRRFPVILYNIPKGTQVKSVHYSIEHGAFAFTLINDQWEDIELGTRFPNFDQGGVEVRSVEPSDVVPDLMNHDNISLSINPKTTKLLEKINASFGIMYGVSRTQLEAPPMVCELCHQQFPIRISSDGNSNICPACESKVFERINCPQCNHVLSFNTAVENIKCDYCETPLTYLRTVRALIRQS